MALANFARRQFSTDYSGTHFKKKDTTKLLNLVAQRGIFYDGYAPFCKIISIANFDGEQYDFPYLRSRTILRKDAFKQGACLYTGYESRNEEELPVLTEWVEGIDLSITKYIHLVIYNAEQMQKEGDNTQGFDWLVVSIQTGNDEKIEPMKPITAMRNVLGIEFGGSGVTLNEQDYKNSVQFWSKYISIR